MARSLPKLPLVRFYRRIPLIPGMLWLNIFKWGISLSIGHRGFRLTLGRSNFRATVGLPGTGLFLTKNVRQLPGSPTKKNGNAIRSSDEPPIYQSRRDNHGKKES